MAEAAISVWDPFARGESPTNVYMDFGEVNDQQPLAWDSCHSNFEPLMNSEVVASIPLPGNSATLPRHTLNPSQRQAAHYNQSINSSENGTVLTFSQPAQSQAASTQIPSITALSQQKHQRQTSPNSPRQFPARPSMPPNRKIGQYICEEVGCSSTFSRESDRVRHEKSVHRKGRLFPCTETGCERSGRPFGRKDHLQQHMLHSHHRAKVTRASAAASFPDTPIVESDPSEGKANSRKHAYERSAGDVSGSEVAANQSLENPRESLANENKRLKLEIQKLQLDKRIRELEKEERDIESKQQELDRARLRLKIEKEEVDAEKRKLEHEEDQLQTEDMAPGTK